MSVSSNERVLGCCQLCPECGGHCNGPLQSPLVKHLLPQLLEGQSLSVPSGMASAAGSHLSQDLSFLVQPRGSVPDGFKSTEVGHGMTPESSSGSRTLMGLAQGVAGHPCWASLCSALDALSTGLDSKATP